MKLKLGGLACLLLAPILLYKIWENGLNTGYMSKDHTIYFMCMIFMKVTITFLCLFMIWFGIQLLRLKK